MPGEAYVIPDSDSDELPPVPRPKTTTTSDPRPRPVQTNNGAGTVSTAYLSQQLLEVEHRLDVLQEQLDSLNAEKTKLVAVRNSIAQQIQQAVDEEEEAEQRVFREANLKIVWKSPKDFAWSPYVPELARHFFNLDGFRPGQLETINATLSQRDVFMIAATGHGKSLTYQLPALLHDSFTLVISPLVSLSRDQVLGLADKGIKAAMVSAQTPKDEEKQILDEMLFGSAGSGVAGASKAAGKMPLAPGARASGPPDYAAYLKNLSDDEGLYDGSLRLVYVTPEKLNKSKRFLNHLEKCYARGRIARIVIDEAHCVSQFSHDFRVDYKKLGIVKQLFPGVPLLCLSATCPPSLVASCFEILGLRNIESDARSGCLVFTTELYRPNLHYSVVPKSSSADSQADEIASWIQDNHPKDTGIVYCLTRKDSEAMAQGLIDRGISAGFYHADCDPAYRDKVHRSWRDKKLAVVCATIAFGLGIDLPDVRFVVHSSIAKSVEGYYQESGRAGRDGKDADCVLFYRPSDYSRLSAMCAGDAEGKRGVLGMLRYCEDLTTCRRVLMERYFGRSTPLQEQSKPEKKCGHCDSCLRDPATLEVLDVTSHAASVCALIDSNKVDSNAGGAKGKGKGKPSEKLTLLKLVDLWRGNGLSKLPAPFSSLQAEAKKLPRLQMERIIIQSVLQGLLEEEIHFTAYSTVSYLRCTSRGQRLVRMFQADQTQVGMKVEVAFAKEEKKKRKRSSVGGAGEAGKGKSKAKRKSGESLRAAAEEIEDEDEENEDAVIVDDDEEESWVGNGDGTGGRMEYDDEEELWEDDSFAYEGLGLDDSRHGYGAGSVDEDDEDLVVPAKKKRQQVVVDSDDE